MRETSGSSPCTSLRCSLPAATLFTMTDDSWRRVDVCADGADKGWVRAWSKPGVEGRPRKSRGRAIAKTRSRTIADFARGSSSKSRVRVRFVRGNSNCVRDDIAGDKISFRSQVPSSDDKIYLEFLVTFLNESVSQSSLREKIRKNFKLWARSRRKSSILHILQDGSCYAKYNMLQILCQTMRIPREKLYIFIYSYKINFILVKIC